MIQGNKIILKAKDEVKIMAEGGEKLARVKKKLKDSISEGIKASEIDELADEFIRKERAKPSFKMVPKYNWATCVNVNGGVVHGIPHENIIFKKGDLVSVDVGLFYRGFHTDTSFSVGIKGGSSLKRFLDSGIDALDRAVAAAKAGNRIYDISYSIEQTLQEKNLVPIRALVGHGIGRELHEPPQIPCFAEGKREETVEIKVGSVFAIEVMYVRGSPNLKVAEDGWTISTRDGKISGLFEETVAVTGDGPVVLTNSH